VIFPHAGPQPRHPSQLYEAGLEGLLLFVVLAVMVRMNALKRPGLILGAFTIVYGCARIFGELFREPDAPTGFVIGQVTMGQLLSVPMIVVGLVLIVRASRLPDRTELTPGKA
jgi:phosphatidylglycerol:prolipoprotein diacylglycerol transferase